MPQSADAGIENVYPAATDKKHRDWINSLMYTPGGPTDVVDQLVVAAFECAISILREAGSPVMFVVYFNACQLDLFLFREDVQIVCYGAEHHTRALAASPARP